MCNKAISSYLISLASYILIYFDTLQEFHVTILSRPVLQLHIQVPPPLQLRI